MIDKTPAPAVNRIFLSNGIGPALSYGSPTTFMMRPSVPLPTGTEIGAPVSGDLHAAGNAIGRLHGDGADFVVAEMTATSRVMWIGRKPFSGSPVFNRQALQDRRKRFLELDIDNGTDDLVRNFSSYSLVDALLYLDSSFVLD
jgi:hypothetical protein